MNRIRRRACPDGVELATLHPDPLLARIYAARGARGPSCIDHRLSRLLDPAGLAGIGEAARLVADAIEGDAPIRIVGDYDADGATGTAVALRGLRLLGARRVGFTVPNRFLHGYGLSPALVAEVPADTALLITVDNGIASHAGVAAAQARGMRVVVTDHHLPGSTLPAADAIVNPNAPGDGFASKALAGVGAMFYLLLAVRATLRSRGCFAGAGPDLAVLLDLVALGTVADLVPLDFNNRVLVAAGLRRIRAGQASPGVAALLAVAGRDPARVTAADLGFAVGPRVNAAGRLEDIGVGIECLATEDPSRARALAERLDAINTERRAVQAEMLEHAEALVAQRLAGADAGLGVGVCLHDADWHPGVVGLVASRLKERLHRPVVAFAPAGEGGDGLRGSARSVPGFHIRDALAAIDVRAPGLIPRFGGHAMAAGLSLAAADLPRFRALFDAVAREVLGDDPATPPVWSDGPLDPAAMTLALAERLECEGPWGQGFPEPLFDGDYLLREVRAMGEKHRRYVLQAPCGRLLPAVHFNVEADAPAQGPVRIAFQLGVDAWRGERRPRLQVRHLEAR